MLRLALLSALFACALGGCETFYAGLCPGDSNCMCTYGDSCGGEEVNKKRLNATGDPAIDGGCSGQCREVQHGRCAGPSSCLYNAGACGSSGAPTGPVSYGIDVSAGVSSYDMGCLKNAGMKWFVTRAYRSYGVVEPAAPGNVKTAHAAGIERIDGYIFPCVHCGNGAGQVSATYNNIHSAGYGSYVTMYWLDIENYKWSSSHSSNQAFIASMISGCKQLAHGKCGVYTSYYNWQSIVGLSYSYPAQQGLPLWYAHYDNRESFSDFTSFGGWTSPTAKQFAGDKTQCSVGVDKNIIKNSAL